MLYLWLKAFHVIFVVAWMSGLLVYPRYKIHQMSSKPGEALFETLSDASGRLRRVILTPSMLLVWLFGISMIVVNPSLLSEGWLYAKFVLVLLLTGTHGYFVALGKKIDAGVKDGPEDRQMRMLNEVPFLLMIVIVILVVIRPF